MEKKAKILLVDDDIDFVESTKIVLESKLYEVIVAYEGDEALRKARGENPDLILLDVIMPVKDGFTAAEQFKKDPQLSKIPVVMLTSYSSRKGETSIPVSRGLELEAEDYVEKPISPEELLSRVEQYLKRVGF
ncbi:MAG: response regulator [Chloroflexi bacterium]|jgi:two-component system alkaline phosphatase synthesis response regulator PhoP|nr:MAG: response regulator [Chloroflexota bacterium]